MNVEQFFHVCRSAAAIANVQEVTVFGAAAIVPWAASVANAQPWPSMELDIDPGSAPAADLVEGSIGEGSLFAEAFGVYAHGVGLEAFVAPPDWNSRAGVFIDPVSGVRVKVPHPVDLTVAKLVRGDPRDWVFAEYTTRTLGVAAADVVHGLSAAAEHRPAYAAAAAAAAAMVPARLTR